MTFKELVSKAGISKAELSRMLGLNARTISAWGDNPPVYALAYLHLLIDYKYLQEKCEREYRD